MKKIYYTWQDVENQTQEILRQLQRDAWMPDYVVGLTRGGLVPANLISQYLEVPMECLKVSLRDDNAQPESNLWMPEDAFGYQLTESVEMPGTQVTVYGRSPKNILIVDDINDSGATLNWIKQDWESSCLPGHHWWNQVWGNNVRVAVLVDNEASASELNVSYSAVDLNKAEENSWIVFPWEDWWK
jgi:hypoxanthine phosphoribosyltransferase